MNAFQSLSALTNALVHPSVAAVPMEQERHRSFIATKLANTFAALAIAPFYLAFHGAPDATGAAIFGLALLPLAAAMIASRTGHLAIAHAVALGGLLAVALTLALGTRVGVGAAFAGLVVAGVEATLSGETVVVRGALPATALASAALLLATSRGWTMPDSEAGEAALAGALTLIYTGPLLHRATSLTRLTLRQLRHQALRARAIDETLGDVVVWLDASGRVDDASAACAAVLGAPALALAGRGLFDRVHVADRPAFLKAIDEAASGDVTAQARIRLRPWHTEPRHLWIELRAKGLTQAGRPTEVVAILRALTARLEHAAEVARAQRSVASAARSKDRFIASMSHELRTPLNAIIGFSEMLGSHTTRPSDTAKQREYARIIHRSGQHLLAVVNSILDMSKIQSGTFVILPEPFGFGPLIDLCCGMLSPDIREGEIELVRDYSDPLEEIVADKRACKQILISLLSNAVKFTPTRGQVTIKARHEGTRMVLTVVDTGIGIAAADLERLGEPFFQARGSLNRPYEGTGLGLSVVRGLIGLHGGSITVESEPDRGTAVTVRLPLDCRLVAADASAIIETVARRPPVEDVIHPRNLRMKQIA